MNLMKHERIVEFIDLEIETFSIVMELMPMGTLANSIRKNTLKSWVQKKQILTDICQGSAFLHASVYSDGRPKKIVLHQDLKSPNVLLGMENGELRAKIADFGLAFLKDFSSDFSKSKSVQHNGGTLTYKAPELYVINAKFTKVTFLINSTEM
jgi:serine/threonine protein kinase